MTTGIEPRHGGVLISLFDHISAFDAEVFCRCEKVRIVGENLSEAIFSCANQVKGICGTDENGPGKRSVNSPHRSEKAGINGKPCPAARLDVAMKLLQSSAAGWLVDQPLSPFAMNG